MNRAIVHNAACNDGTTFVCIASGVIFSNCVISKCKDSEKNTNNQNFDGFSFLILYFNYASHSDSCAMDATEGNRLLIQSRRQSLEYVQVLSDEMNRSYELCKFMDSIKIFPIFSTYTRFKSMSVLTRPPTIPLIKSCSSHIISCTHDVNWS